MTAEDPSTARPVPPPGELEGMEVRDASGAPTGRVEDVYVDRETTTIRYVALACDEPGNYRPCRLGSSASSASR